MYSRKRIEKFAKYGDAKEKFEKKSRANVLCILCEAKHILFWSDRSKVSSILVNIYNMI